MMSIKPEIKLLFDLNKVTEEDLLLLVKRDILKRVGRKYTNLTGPLEADELYELIPSRTYRVKTEIWHRGETIVKTAAEFYDIFSDGND